MRLPAYPKLRDDVTIIYDQERRILRFEDERGYVREDLAFEQEFHQLFELLDGEHSLEQIVAEARRAFDGNISLQHLAQLFAWLDEELLLDSPRYRRALRFLESDVVEPVCAGSVYPADPNKLRDYLDSILQLVPERAYPQHARIAFIPHIDYRVAAEHYAYPFNALRQSEFDLVVHIGTSHYGWQDRFLLTAKDFLTPLGRIKTDVALVEELRREIGIPLVRNDLAYQPEHALELHHVFLQHLFPDREFTVLPVLVTSFHDYLQRGQHPSMEQKFTAFVDALRRIIERSGRQVLILISGDLAHIGRRFGDEWDAAPMLDQLRGEDHEVLDAIASGKSENLFETIARSNDARRICGFPPAMTMLTAFKPGKGMVLDYGQWNDMPTKSAVSFGTVVWYD